MVLKVDSYTPSRRVVVKISDNSLYKERRKITKATGDVVLDSFQLDVALTHPQAKKLLNSIGDNLTYEELVKRVKRLGFGDGKSLSSNVDNLKLGDMFVSDEHGEGVITQLTNSLLLVEFGNYEGGYYKDTMGNIANRKDTLTKKSNTIEKEMKCQ